MPPSSLKQKPSRFSPPRTVAVLLKGHAREPDVRLVDGGDAGRGFCDGTPPGVVSFARGAATTGNTITRSRTEVEAIPSPKQAEARINERIRVPQVRVIADDGEQVGVLPVREALELAQSKGLDLVEVSPTARPPVCRIMDYGKFKYEQSRRQRKAKKKQHHTQLKEIKMRPKIEGHDYGFKVNHAREFLEARDKVKITIMFRGREMARQENGHRLIRRVIEELADVATVENPPRAEGRSLSAVLMPRPARTGGTAAAPGEASTDAAARKPSSAARSGAGAASEE